jgi:sugar phosphate isomerase/epimerase
VQLYTLRDAAKADLDRTLADIAAAGYTDVELLMSLHNFGHSPKAVRAMLDKHHLRAPSTHIGTETLANVDGAVDEARTLGHKYLILADLPGEARQSLDAFAAYADRLNRAGEAARKHDSVDRLARRGGRLQSRSAASRATMRSSRSSTRVLVRLQLDTGNAMVGGRDPLDLMNRYGDRYYSSTSRTRRAEGRQHDVGARQGDRQPARHPREVKNLDDKYFYVEQETYTGTPLEAVQRDYATVEAQLLSGES